MCVCSCCSAGRLLDLIIETLHDVVPTGRKVYQRGAHTIWEVDGAVAKVQGTRTWVSGCSPPHAAVLPKSVIIWKTLHRHQDHLLR